MIETTLKSTRLHLELITHSDIEFIHNLLSHEVTDRYNALGIPESLEETIHLIAPWINENQVDNVINHTWIIKNQATQENIGLIGLKLSNNKYHRGEVWYKIHPDQWRQGYATEALKRVIDFGFDQHNLHRIQAGCAVENTASIRVLEKVGMTKEGRGRQLLPLKSGWSDNFEFSILESDPRP